MENPNRTRTVDEHHQQAAAEDLCSKLPKSIGRYRVEKVLGKGGFGLVFLAHDDQLQRLVAIKVPRSKLSGPDAAEAYLAEARTIAILDHPNIVPVHDVGSTKDYPWFIVSKYIEGSALSQMLKEQRLSMAAATEMVATIAEALHYAHRKGLVHRDIKPGNIIIDKSGKPFVVDFGLALKEENVGHGPKYAGTPAYMSPEQARGEGHRVDGRSDVFSLGVVFYELLVGRQPFRADSEAEQREQITNFEPRPPRQYDDSIPKELDRICLKALSKRASDRYSAAKDMADDLRQFLVENTIHQQSSPGIRIGPSPSVTAAAPSSSISTGPSRADTSAITPTSDSQPIKIVPKGLRSFDAQDADFFLELLPGPRDRNGLPDSLRFWKARIEEKESERTFSVGLICGPSGCGKSSLVKAGLLPRLADDVLAVYLEATAEETETRLLNGLRKRFPGSSSVANASGSGLKETLAALRRGQGVPPGKKVLIVIDQFEQWLHAKKAVENSELVQALRQCDGGRVQCIVMVRDDFWMAVIRFMHELENRLVEGHNSAAVDLFPVRHAEKVLAAFGRAFGDLPDSSAPLGKEQKQFLEQAVAGLAQEGKVICVRLALFAEMIKGKPWTPATLKAVGGTEGVGVTFLEETFSAASAPPEHRYHQKAAKAVLGALLPESGTDIKGTMRSQTELLQASGYGSRSRDFNDLIRILDSEIRLITPTDPEGKDEGEPGGVSPRSLDTRYYQLTHDYMVPSLRNWLTRKQKESKRGRAELLLADRAAVWNGRPENRQLPSLGQWLSIRWWTKKRNWTPPQRKMMRKASRYHAARGLGLAVLLVVGTLSGFGIHNYVLEQNAAHAAGLVQSLASADITHVPEIIKEMTGYRDLADPLLKEAFAQAQKNADTRKQLHVSLALLPVDPNQKDYLYHRLLDAAPSEVPVLRTALAPHQEALLDKLWAIAEQPPQGKEQQRLRAACALATYDPDSQRWEKIQDPVASDLVTVPSMYLATWQDSLRPVRGKLVAPLTVVYRDANRKESQRTPAAKILADYAADDTDLLTDLLLDADPKQFVVLYPSFRQHEERGRALLDGELDKKLLPSASDWKVRFYAWEKAEANKPPADWEAVLKSPVLDELNMARLFFNDKKGLPTAKVPKEYFAAVATCEVILSKNSYAFTVSYNDGVRVWFDDKVVFEDWKSNKNVSKYVQVKTEPGRHALKVDYFQITQGYLLEFDEDQEAEHEALAKRQANAAAALARMNDFEKVWPLLKHIQDPRVRSYVTDRLGPLGVDPVALVKRLAMEPDVTSQRALILSLGEFDEGQLPASDRSLLIDRLCAIYESEPDAGLHGTAAWLLRQWKQGEKLKALDDKLQTKEDQLYLTMLAHVPKEQRSLSSDRLAKIAGLQTQIADIEKKLPEMRVTWERQLRDQPPAWLQEGLITHYSLDEKEGLETANLVKGQPRGTYEGTTKPEWVPGVMGRALRLDGKGRFDCGTDLQLERTDAMSYGCWFLARTILLNQLPSVHCTLMEKCVTGKKDDPDSSRGFGIHLDLKNKMVKAEWTNQWPENYLLVYAELEEPTDRWHHLFVTYDGSSTAAGARIYLDGKPAPTRVEKDKLTQTIQNSVPLQIGRRNKANSFKGDIDDVRIYNRRLTDKEVAQIYETGIQALAGVPSQERTPELQKLLDDNFRARNEPFQQSLKELTQVKALKRKLESDSVRDSVRRWYVNGQGQTLVVIPGPVDFLMGSPLSENNRSDWEIQHPQRIGWTFAIAAQPVTKEQYLLFNPKFNHNGMRLYPDPTCPIGGLTWFRAAAYCNWLSKQEGIDPDQWCYETGPTGAVTKLKENYQSLTGYRLPTEAELEFAIRAGAVTSRFYGESEELLGKYAWFLGNSDERTWPVGSKKPNDLGLFDMLGNVACWTQEQYKPILQEEKKTSNTKKPASAPKLPNSRNIRGGSFQNQASNVRSAARSLGAPNSAYINVGFRVARTLVAD